MRRKLLGFVLLLMVVAAGIAFVEWGPAKVLHAEPAGAADPARLRVILGDPGASPSAPRLDAAGPDAAGPTGDSAPEGPPGGGVHAADAAGISGAAGPPAEFRVLVRAGDTLTALVRDHLGSGGKAAIDRVARRNRLLDPDRLEVGTELVLPVARYDRHRTAGGETPRDVARRWFGSSTRLQPLLLANPALRGHEDRALPAGTLVWIPR